MNQPLAVFYDTDCSFCKNACVILCGILLLKNVSMRPVTEDGRALAIFEEEYSWSVLDTKSGMYYSKASALFRLVQASPFHLLYYISYVPYALHIGDSIYDIVARSRPGTCTV